MAGAAARGGATTLGGQLLRFLIQLASVTVLARLIAPSDYGLYTMVFAILGIATVIGDFGLSMAAIQSQTITQPQRSNLFWTNAGLGVVLFALTLLAAPFIASFYGDPRLTGIAQWLSVTFLLSSLSAQFRAEATAKLRFAFLAATDVAAAAISFAVAVVLASLGLGYWSLVVQQIAMTAATLIGLIIAAHWWPGLPSRTTGMRSLYQYGANTLGVQLFVSVTSNVDSVLVGKFWGASALGLYDRAFRVFRLPLQQIAAPMTKVGVPILSKLQSDARYNAYVIRAQLLLGYLFGGTFFMLAALSNPLIELLLGPGWESAKPIFAVLAVGGVFQGMGFVYAWVFLSRALTGLQLRWTIIGRSFMVGAMCVGVIWGPVGVAAGATIGQAVNWLLLTMFPIAKTGVPRGHLVTTALRPVALYTPIAVVVFVLSYTALYTWNAWLQLALLVPIIAVYLAVAVLLRPIRRDFQNLLDTVKRFRR